MPDVTELLSDPVEKCAEALYVMWAEYVKQPKSFLLGDWRDLKNWSYERRREYLNSEAETSRGNRICATKQHNS